MEKDKINFQAIVNFVLKNGEPFERSFLAALFNCSYIEKFSDQVKQYQNEDGGWIRLDADYKGKVSSVTCSIMLLSKLNCLNLHNELYDRTYRYLKMTQKEYGYWDEPRQIILSKPPRWFYPNCKENQIWFTNAVVRYLLSMGCEDQSLLDAGIGYVKQFYTKEGIQGYPHNNWMGIVTFSKSMDKLSKEIQECCFKNLYNDCESFDSYNLAWTLESLISLNLTLEHPLVMKLWGLLQQCKQCEDGGIETESGEHFRVDLACRIVYTALKLEVIDKDGIKIE